MSIIIPSEYKNKLSLVDTEKAIKLAKDTFEKKLSEHLNLTRVSAPLFVLPESGLNDNLNGYERPVSFDIKESGKNAEIVHSLAKWKRNALAKYLFKDGEGLYTDMNAIRRDEETDNLHSLYVDQWDWEKIITKKDRNIDFLKTIVRKINTVLIETKEIINQKFNALNLSLNNEVFFITAEELLKMYPEFSAKERENIICKEKKNVFIIGIGEELSNGIKHDGRAPDYDDWQLNGDFLLWYEPLNCAIEISSMGIRVDKHSMLYQLEKANATSRLNYEYHQKIVNDELPLTIGGGIGQSRICMIMLEKIHIGEVQVSIWSEDDLTLIRKNKINIL
ncbi:MAG: aspartate--ammonia ligase [Bacilli bacterium]|nr:aspartate--ammonia ligase [Bacilli bacterium]